MGKKVTNKSLAKRIKFTKTGKTVRRPMGVNHFKTRKNSKGIQKKRAQLGLNFPLKQLLNY